MAVMISPCEGRRNRSGDGKCVRKVQSVADFVTDTVDNSGLYKALKHFGGNINVLMKALATKPITGLK